jgi:hypothetical protein
LEEEGGAMDADSSGQQGNSAVIKTSTRQVTNFFLFLKSIS